MKLLHVVALRHSGAGPTPFRKKMLPHGLVAVVRSQIVKCPGDPVVTPGGILFGEPHDEFFDVDLDGQPTGFIRNREPSNFLAMS